MLNQILWGLATLVASVRKRGYHFTIDDANNCTARSDAFVEGEISGQNQSNGTTVIATVAIEVVLGPVDKVWQPYLGGGQGE
ncbi:hypothetical protein GOL38_32590 [Sinorhizobium medicae]|nr:hypothetical protein [Sinorhizobium medicae]